MWYFIAVLSSVMWGVADALYERTFDDNDSLCSYKFIVFTGLSGIIVFIATRPFSETGFGVFELLLQYRTFFFIPLAYICAIFCEIKALKTIDQSIVSPVANTSSAFILFMLLLFYFLTGNKEKAMEQVSFFSVAGTLIMTLGMVFLAQNTDEKNATGKRKTGLLIFLLPVLGALFEGLETVFETLLIDDVIEEGMGTIDFIRLYSFFVVIIGFIVWIFVSIKEKKPYLIKSGKDFCFFGTSFCEYIVLVPYCLALDNKPFFTAVVSSVYSVFTVLFCKVINKTKLSKKQYFFIGVIIFGILLFTFTDF